MRLRENKVNIVGRSLILNVISILLNVIGVFFIAKGFHVSSGDNGVIYLLIGFITFITGILGLFAMQGMHMFSFVARAFVGGLFIVSGLVKANDPWGFAFKLEEYFSPMGLTYDFSFFEMFQGYELQLSILICIAEIVLGVAVIVGGKIKLTSWLLVFLMMSFTWLTYYTYSCVDANELLSATGVLADRDCVTDCGCFGDALKGSVGRSLSPYESFWKDIVLFYFVLIIFINQWKITLNTTNQNWIMVPASLIVVIFFSWVFGWYFPIFFYLIALLGAFVFGNMNIGKLDKAWQMAIYVGVVSLLFSAYTTMYLPAKDYRAYAIGNNIKNEMNSGVAEVADFEFVYTNKQTGEDRNFGVSEYVEYGDTTKWEYFDRIKTVIMPGVDATIMDFLLTANYVNITEEEKNNSVMDSLVMWDFDMYYENKIVQKSIYGLDTVSAYEYQPYLYDTASYGPDTIFYEKIESFSGLMDPTTPYNVNVTEYILTLDNVLLLTIRDIESINNNAIDGLKEMYFSALENDIPFYILSPATDEQISLFRTEFEFEAPFLSIDGTEVKIIVRSNPGLVLLQKATIIDKWPSRSIPSYEYIQSNYLK
jgi:uncharacterized membrane protein YphA (DoxX/SURF4 family)